MNIKTRHGGLEDKSTYVVTEDLFYLVGRWCEKKGVKNAEDVLDKEFFLRLLDSLTKSIKEYCFSKKNVEVVGLDTEAFNDLLMKRDHPSNKKFKEFWVALDDVYPRPREECESKYNISITRYITQDMEEFLKDRSGNDREDMGRGPRPEGHAPPLDDQVRECVNQYHKTLKKRSLSKDEFPLVLIAAGTWDGKTIISILNKFAAQGETLRAVRLGVAHTKGITRISEWSKPNRENRTSYRVPFIGASKLCPPLEDWVCERDFFPGVLYGGRVVGKIDSKGNLLPLKVKGLPVRAQYLHEWGKPEWASIREGGEHLTITALLL